MLGQDQPQVGDLYAAFGAVVDLHHTARQRPVRSVTDLMRWVAPPLKRGFYRLFVSEGQPVGYVSWAWLDGDAARRFVEELEIEPDAWASGDQLWQVDTIALPGHIQDIGRRMCAELGPALRDTPINYIRPGRGYRIGRWTIPERYHGPDACAPC